MDTANEGQSPPETDAASVELLAVSLTFNSPVQSKKDDVETTELYETENTKTLSNVTNKLWSDAHRRADRYRRAVREVFNMWTTPFGLPGLGVIESESYPKFREAIDPLLAEAKKQFHAIYVDGYEENIAADKALFAKQKRNNFREDFYPPKAQVASSIQVKLVELPIATALSTKFSALTTEQKKQIATNHRQHVKAIKMKALRQLAEKLKEIEIIDGKTRNRADKLDMLESMVNVVDNSFSLSKDEQVKAFLTDVRERILTQKRLIKACPQTRAEVALAATELTVHVEDLIRKL